MILFTALGLGARLALDWSPGVGAGLLAGLLLANLVPARSAACHLPPREGAEAPPGD